MAPPKFMGLTGRPLSLMVSTVATTGFVLFGYDQGVSKQRPQPFDLIPYPMRLARGVIGRSLLPANAS